MYSRCLPEEDVNAPFCATLDFCTDLQHTHTHTHTHTRTHTHARGDLNRTGQRQKQQLKAWLNFALPDYRCAPIAHAHYHLHGKRVDGNRRQNRTDRTDRTDKQTEQTETQRYYLHLYYIIIVLHIVCS